jgi:hypothetical protein
MGIVFQGIIKTLALSDSDCVFASWRQRKQRFKDTKGVINHNP